jgi:hypothetical protein
MWRAAYCSNSMLHHAAAAAQCASWTVAGWRVCGHLVCRVKGDGHVGNGVSAYAQELHGPGRAQRSSTIRGMILTCT